MYEPSQNLSVWNDTENMPQFSQLDTNFIADICVIGGGIAGLSMAYLQMKEGESVCLLESAELASGQSGLSTAHLTCVLDKTYLEIEKNLGTRAARLVAESQLVALNKIEKIIARENIDCDFKKVNAYLFSEPDADPSSLKNELKAAERVGINAVMLEKAPLPFKTGACLCYPNQLQFHPVKYLKALAQLIVKGDGKIFTHSPVTGIHNNNPILVKTKNKGYVECRSAVIATNTLINNLVGRYIDQETYKTYVIGVQIPKRSITEALYWDTQKPNHYLRIGPDISDAYDILLVGGENQKANREIHPKYHFDRLESWMRARFPESRDVIYKWSGEIMNSADGLPYLGYSPNNNENTYVITGDSGNGLTSGTLGAILINDLIMSRYNQWEQLYKPSRRVISATTHYIKENIMSFFSRPKNPPV